VPLFVGAARLWHARSPALKESDCAAQPESSARIPGIGQGPKPNRSVAASHRHGQCVCCGRSMFIRGAGVASAQRRCLRKRWHVLGAPHARRGCGVCPAGSMFRPLHRASCELIERGQRGVGRYQATTSGHAMRSRIEPSTWRIFSRDRRDQRHQTSVTSLLLASTALSISASCFFKRSWILSLRSAI